MNVRLPEIVSFIQPFCYYSYLIKHDYLIRCYSPIDKRFAEYCVQEFLHTPSSRLFPIIMQWEDIRTRFKQEHPVQYIQAHLLFNQTMECSSKDFIHLVLSIPDLTKRKEILSFIQLLTIAEPKNPCFSFLLSETKEDGICLVSLLHQITDCEMELSLENEQEGFQGHVNELWVASLNSFEEFNEKGRRVIEIMVHFLRLTTQLCVDNEHLTLALLSHVLSIDEGLMNEDHQNSALYFVLSRAYSVDILHWLE